MLHPHIKSKDLQLMILILSILSTSQNIFKRVVKYWDCVVETINYSPPFGKKAFET